MSAEQLTHIRHQVYCGDVTGGRIALRELLAANPELTDDSTFCALFGFTLLRCEEAEAGREMLDQARLVPPLSSAGLADLGGGFYLVGKLRRAHDYLTAAVAMKEAGAAAFSRLALVQMARGDMALAEQNFLKARELDPDHPVHQYNIANLFTHLGRLEEALPFIRRALELNPDLDQAISLRNQLLVGLDQAAEVIDELEKKLELTPDSVPLRIMLANLLEADGRFPEAYSFLKEAVDLEPENVELLIQLAKLYLSRQQNGPAIKALLKAEKIEPDNPQLLSLLARTLAEAGNHEKADVAVEKLLAKNPRNFQSFLARAQVRLAIDDTGGAEQDLRRALELWPGALEAHCSLAHLFMQTGRFEEAIDSFKHAASLNPTALAGLIEARSFPDDPKVIGLMQKMADNPLLQRGPRISLSFALTKLFEKQQQYDLAFHYAGQANQLSNKTIIHRKNRHHRMVEIMAKNFSKEFHDRLRATGSRSERPVFVVGMPRSGTTLTEQILCSHPAVFGAGELGYITAITRLMPKVVKKEQSYPICLGSLQRWMLSHAASYYLKKISRLDQKAARVVDKLPHNFLHLGLINLIFPRAKIIHVQRDFRDVAISNYFTNFKHKHGGMSYAFDLQNIGQMINDYRLIMDHWRRILPPGVIYEFRYEDLVEEPEKKGRELLTFIGLDWDDKLLEFHRTERAVKTASVWQVRQPLYQSSKERWRNYETFLTPLMEVLAEYPPQFG
ncbi:MAG: sulfotransferase [Proteobacteria bacterium]|nr:sulfotransferase [Pseudomonadota bacterium]MBU1716358.1 sulfotransferase [Pseudomonadota bacterium]